MGNSLSLAFYLATRGRSRADPAMASGDKQEQDRQAEIQGLIATPRPPGPLIWFHTGHDQTAPAVRELARRLLGERDDAAMLITTSARARQHDDGALIDQFAPQDSRAAVRRFLRHWSPDVAVWTEPDLRPVLISEAHGRGVPLFLIDARGARPDPQAWRWWRGMTGSLLSRFRRVLAGDADAGATLHRLGADPATLEIAGFLEEGAPALSCNEAERDALAARLAARPVWLAAGVDDGECGAVAAAQAVALRGSHRLLLVVVPSDPRAGDKWRHDINGLGLSCALRSEGADPDPQVQAYIADAEAEMGLWYRLAPISFLGQSLDGGGGIDPFHAAALGSAIIHGPDVEAHRQAYSRLADAGAARLVRTRAELGDAVESLLHPDQAAAMAHAAWSVCSSGAEVTDRVMDLVLDALDQGGAGG